MKFKCKECGKKFHGAAKQVQMAIGSCTRMSCPQNNVDISLLETMSSRNVEKKFVAEHHRNKLNPVVLASEVITEQPSNEQIKVCEVEEHPVLSGVVIRRES